MTMRWMEPDSAFVLSLCPELRTSAEASTPSREAVARCLLEGLRSRARGALGKIRHDCVHFAVDDLVGEAVVRLEQTGLADGFNAERGDAGALVFRTMILLTFEHVRKCTRRCAGPMTVEAADGGPGPDELAATADLLDEIKRRAGELPPKQRRAVLRRLRGDGVPETTLWRALKALKALCSPRRPATC